MQLVRSIFHCSAGNWRRPLSSSVRRIACGSWSDDVGCCLDRTSAFHSGRVMPHFIPSTLSVLFLPFSI